MPWAVPARLVSRARPLLRLVIWQRPAGEVAVPLGVTVRWWPAEAFIVTGTVIEPPLTG